MWSRPSSPRATVAAVEVVEDEAVAVGHSETDRIGLGAVRRNGRGIRANVQTLVSVGP